MRRILISTKGEFKEAKERSVTLSVAFRLVVDFYSVVDKSKEQLVSKVVISNNVHSNTGLKQIG